MPTSPRSRPQTLKAAKKAYSKRGRVPALSEAERRRLARAAELERRAETIREKERKKKENAQKRAEKVEREKEKRRRMGRTSQEPEPVRASQSRLNSFFGCRVNKDDGDAGQEREESAEGIGQQQTIAGDADTLVGSEEEYLDGQINIVKRQPTVGLPDNDSHILKDEYEATMSHMATLETDATTNNFIAIDEGREGHDSDEVIGEGQRLSVTAEVSIQRQVESGSAGTRSSKHEHVSAIATTTSSSPAPSQAQPVTSSTKPTISDMLAQHVSSHDSEAAENLLTARSNVPPRSSILRENPCRPALAELSTNESNRNKIPAQSIAKKSSHDLVSEIGEDLLDLFPSNSQVEREMADPVLKSSSEAITGISKPPHYSIVTKKRTSPQIYCQPKFGNGLRQLQSKSMSEPDWLADDGLDAIFAMASTQMLTSKHSAPTATAQAKQAHQRPSLESHNSRPHATGRIGKKSEREHRRAAQPARRDREPSRAIKSHSRSSEFDDSGITDAELVALADADA